MLGVGDYDRLIEGALDERSRSGGAAVASHAQLDTRFFTTPDGRTLAYVEYGDPGGVPVFYAHGGPGSRLEGILFHVAAAQHGFRFIATDRPGMGQSSFMSGRRLLDYPRDIADLADALGIDRFGVLGWSGGGAHTVVCGYAIPERLLFNVSLCGYTNRCCSAACRKERGQTVRRGLLAAGN